MTVYTPRVDEHTRTLRAENDALSKALAAHREFLADLGRYLASGSDVGDHSVAVAIDVFLTEQESW